MNLKLKSDQNGIEILLVGGFPRLFWLKSDQNGIEIAGGCDAARMQVTVKIRPKWD